MDGKCMYNIYSPVDLHAFQCYQPKKSSWKNIRIKPIQQPAKEHNTLDFHFNACRCITIAHFACLQHEFLVELVSLGWYVWCW